MPVSFLDREKMLSVPKGLLLWFVEFTEYGSTRVAFNFSKMVVYGDRCSCYFLLSVSREGFWECK